jgi:hypothetical protein
MRATVLSSETWAAFEPEPRTGHRRFRRALRFTGTALLVVCAAAANVLRATSWTQSRGFVWGPLASRDAPPSLTIHGAVMKLEVVVPAWRPIRITLSAEAADPTRPARLALSTIPSEPGTAVTVRSPTTFAIVVEASTEPADRVVLWLTKDREADGPVEIRNIQVEPVLGAGGIAAHAAIGAVAALLLAWLVVPRRAWRLERPPPVDSLRIARAPLRDVVVIGGVATLFLVWALARPPYQSPDEFHHYSRVTSVPALPWVAGDWRFQLSPAFRNPLNWDEPRLHALVSRPDVHLSREDVLHLRRIPWRPPTSYPPVVITGGSSSYPPGYYGLAFLGGEGFTWLFQLQPYASTMAYRIATMGLAVAVWAIVYRTLRVTHATAAHAIPLFLLLVGNPMSAAMGASISPDAVNVPAIVLLMLAAWGIVAEGRRERLFLFAAMLALFTKTTGIMALCAVAAGAILLWAGKMTTGRRTIALLRWSLVSLLIAWFLFYMWSPTRVQPASGDALAPTAYLANLVARIPGLWVQYWGLLGWQDYRLADGWYWGLAGLFLLGAVVAWRERQISRGFIAFVLGAGTLFALFIVAVEFRNQSHSPTLQGWIQGRYFLPASLALAPAVMHRRRAWGLVVPLYLLAMNVALLQETVRRYYAGDLQAFWMAATPW